MEENLHITLLQTSLYWEDKAANLSMFDKKLEEVKEHTDLIVLPEMFSTGFSMRSEILAETMDGETLKWMRLKAAQKKCVITGSVIIKEEGAYYNRLLWVSPDGDVKYYSKRHLFRMAKENNYYNSGSERLVVELKGWKIAPLICYDLRFPVWSRRTKMFDYDALIYVANWPERRNHPWKTLLMARAIENQSYVAGVNRVGLDGNNIIHSGDSAVIDFKGEKISSLNAFEEKAETITLNKQTLSDFRQSFPAHMDADEFEIRN